MRIHLTIRTDSCRLCDKQVEAPSVLRAVLDELRERTTAAVHLADLPFANLCIQARPVKADAAQGTERATLNQEVVS